jgi:hypothetical protein
MSRQIRSEPAQAGKGGVLLNVKVQPRAQKPGVQGLRNNALLVRLKAAPEKGRANSELIAALSDFFDAARADFEITSGTTSRDKRVLISNTTLERVNSRLDGLPEL